VAIRGGQTQTKEIIPKRLSGQPVGKLGCKRMSERGPGASLAGPSMLTLTADR